MPSNCPVLPSFHAQHKIIDSAPKSAIRRSSMCHRLPSSFCNIAITLLSLFVPYKSERSLWFWQMGAVVKPSKYGIAGFSLPLIHLFVLNRGGLQRCIYFVFVFSKASVRFPSRHRRSPFVFCFPENRECSVTLHILWQYRIFVLFPSYYPKRLYPKTSDHTAAHHQIPQLPLWQWVPLVLDIHNQTIPSWGILVPAWRLNCVAG